MSRTQASEPIALDATDRAIINALQGGFPLCDRPFEVAGAALELGEATLIERLATLLDRGVLSRFGPMYNADRIGGAFSLCALQVPAERFEAVAAQVNAYPEVAHNYAREHQLNMWFVVGTESPGRIGEVLAAIETQTGLKVYDFPKLREFFVGLRFEA